MSGMSYWSEHVQARALRQVEHVWGKVRNSLSLPNWRVRLRQLRCFDQQRCRLVCVAFALVQGSAAAVHISAANLARREKRVRSGSQTRHTWRPSICIGSCVFLQLRPMTSLGESVCFKVCVLSVSQPPRASALVGPWRLGSGVPGPKPRNVTGLHRRCDCEQCDCCDLWTLISGARLH